MDADAFKLTKALSETVFARSKEGDEPVIEDDLKKLGEVLSKDKLTKLQVQQVIHFVRDLFLDTKPKESTNAMVSKMKITYHPEFISLITFTIDLFTANFALLGCS